ncbi:ABC transporter ATP-binding protein [Porphyromonas catoniae]|jgi:ABC transporter, ATP-binding protein|uniref:ABC transporter ATP-binding protein n=1 Tax=Porphyromonas catoniae TaxID=41976 RepID=UPI0028D3B162|nr:ABC transporter ATP-binding protein [Porphyromonas catoniae]
MTFLQHRLALSPSGERDFKRGVLYTTLLNIAFILPITFIFLFLSDYLRPLLGMGEPTYSWTLYAGLAIAFSVILYILSGLQYKSTFEAVYNESANRRIRVAEKLRRLPLAFFGQHDLSDLTSTVMADNTELEHTFSHAVPQLFAAVISVLLIALGLFFYDWRLALSIFWVVPLALVVILFARRLVAQRFIENYQLKRRVTEDIQQGIENIREIKAYNGEEAYLRDLNLSLMALEKEMIRDELSGSVLINTSVALLKLGLVSVIITGITLLETGKVDLMTYLIFLVFGAGVYAPVEEVFNYSILLSYLDVRIKRMREIEEMPTQTGKTDYTLRGYDITFSHVDFSYEEGKQVLRDISFTAKQGEITALVGPSGGGKSTIAKLAARFWDIDNGLITLGGEDISKIDPEALLSHFAIVFQDVVLFNTSVLENIRIGRQSATDEEVREAARLARCEDFITRLPDGYETVIGENGQKLSGGERQRISIARALLKNAPVILLDEATASLDVENETLMQEGISELVKDKTVLIIAHRMRTIRRANQVVVLRDGAVSEYGTPDDLLARHGDFASLVERQS